MRAIFMIPTKPPPTLSEPDRWSSEFNDFLSHCLKKSPDERPKAKDLLRHPFIRQASKFKENVMLEMIQQAKDRVAEKGGWAKMMQYLDGDVRFKNKQTNKQTCSPFILFYSILF